jgi:putative membrane protein
MLYLWVKAFHIVFVASWFAGLFYLPRIFVNLAMVPADSHAERERLLLMGRKLYRFASLLMVPAIGLGLWLWLGWGVSGGLAARQAAAGAGRHRIPPCLPHGQLRRFEHLENRRSDRWFRVFNETSVLLFAAIVVLVVVKPF